MSILRLGVNIDHVATVRNARGGMHPDPVAAAHAVARVGADGITAHLREDRRHIRDDDIFRLKEQVSLPLNLEMAAVSEMVDIALRCQPAACCLVPERREERTTEGGLDVVALLESLRPCVAELSAAGIRVSLFVTPDVEQIQAARDVGARVVELHTGRYCEAGGEEREHELRLIKEAALRADALGLECHAGHGLSYETVGPIAAIPTVSELNIGHFLIGEAIFTGLEAAVKRMRDCMETARRASP
ncbi:pyridoxine 5'-phosphate synthase [Haematospirillum jordaniae]|uniref:Pyridoxine 5'-phosphate synthase n=1 Tax=Haematospirillum jordaniae TaxID=1549855 RepID=A0A143DEG9_9PROT|nr:pyridoxine 5'-phosphate synthase [Haematospirillum jordaniae]AMW35124.1 pyridoxine 5'-phosphate synthase [Haematospirillum jordaniae]NKD44115.1 pyridoxine 5'-phosphate synthase [Haematospirillum jordaniae]NKD56493.1 pyridoxine 5'-phosphate synthase [Haematospirillum jordaniae]NKD58551.1 pyridoxine 5'-phosphate synthase [Haematospirillum jordaniae]NKD66280.1 pyridoxine 5'-phosphate synthase [Haematospirillum jordaniae]